MLFLILLCFVIIAFAAFVYMQDGTNFTKLTNYSSFDILFDQNARKLQSIYRALERVEGHYEVLLSIHIKTDAANIKIPAILIHESGIHVFTSENFDGWIVGSDRSLEWANVRYKKETVHFENPVLVNRRHIYALKDVLPELPSTAFQTVVLFNNGCSFQKVEISSQNVEVLKQKELNAWADSLVGNVLSAEDITTIYAALKDKMVFQKKLASKASKGKKVLETR